MTTDLVDTNAAKGQAIVASRATINLAEEIHWLLASIVYLLLVIVTIRLRWFSLTNHDVAWLVTAAGRWLDGARYGRDIIEINTPAAMLLYVPPVWLAKLTNLPLGHLIDLWLSMIALAAAILAGHAVATSAGVSARSRLAFLTTFLIYVVLTFYPAYDFAQRDHFVAALLLPYALTTMNSAEASFRRADRLLAASLAAAALCIKPQYLLVTFGIWAVGLARHLAQRQGGWTAWRRTLWQSDLPFIVVIGLLYIAAVIVVFPDWLPMLWRMQQFYSLYSAPFLQVLGNSLSYFVPLGIGATALCFPLPGRRFLQDGLLLASLTMLLVFLEHKPWAYHYLPILLFLGCGAATTLVISLPALTAFSRRPAAIAAVVALIPIYLATSTDAANRNERDIYDSTLLAPVLQKFAQKGDHIAFLSIAIPPGFPLVLEEGYVWALRYPCLWTLAGAAGLHQKGKLGDADMEAALQEIGTAVAQDLGQTPTKVVVVDLRPFKEQFPNGLDIVALLSHSPGFAQQWQNYALQTTDGGFAIYQRSQ